MKQLEKRNSLLIKDVEVEVDPWRGKMTKKRRKRRKVKMKRKRRRKRKKEKKEKKEKKRRKVRKVNLIFIYRILLKYILIICNR